MRIVKREEFLSLPKYTLFSEYFSHTYYFEGRDQSLKIKMDSEAPKNGYYFIACGNIQFWNPICLEEYYTTITSSYYEFCIYDKQDIFKIHELLGKCL